MNKYLFLVGLFGMTYFYVQAQTQEPTLNTVLGGYLNVKLQDKLAYDARHISESIDINHQREHFTSLSANMITLAKRAQLSLEAVYEDYCPMKKSYWLSSDTAIQNPYYGKTMPGCGKITTTLNPK